ncbi:hypothetical protein [Actinomycetospora cinnamomea]|uniref:Uncharacterized protein n=1 Tax=Actinomycetospora cinnamomea TaxID=663609 RepID=A0A2U1FFS2_9PSEU|nr:hypothetical protein [Actinomycetospora cinnamomea]PVZ11007.1 hypothetical protein C8D89_104221 [Actinomycetospora cinnamomea]
MAKPGRARRDRSRTVAGRRHEDLDELVRRVLPQPPARGERADGGLTVQLLPHYLAAGSLPAFRVGDDVELAPAIYADAHLPVVSGRDRCTVDEYGCADARGTIVTAPLEPGACDCAVDVLDVGGRLFPLNWAATRPASGRVWVEGALYWAPELDAGTPHGEAVTLCRRRFRVREMRRYIRTGHVPRSPVRLGGLPDPDEVDEHAVYVADLRTLDDERVPTTAAERAHGSGQR